MFDSIFYPRRRCFAQLKISAKGKLVLLLLACALFAAACADDSLENKSEHRGHHHGGHGRGQQDSASASPSTF